VLKGQYQLEREIGHGGVGVVYVAHDLEHERVAQGRHLIAVKLLRAEYRQKADLVKALFEEVSLTKEMTHPNIVSVFNCQRDGQEVFMTMQYLEGVTLDRLIRRDYPRGMPWERARFIIEGVGRALAYAHDHRVIHCDVKPSNVFVSLAGTAKVLDFGIARATRRHRGPGAPRGLTLGYATPEAIQAWQKESEGGAPYQATESDDIFSYACLVYEILSGRRPFDPDDADTARQKGRAYASIPDLSRRQNAALANALAFDPNRRTNRIEDLINALQLESDGISSGDMRLRWIGSIAAVLLVAAIGVASTRSHWFERKSDALSPIAVAPAREAASAPLPADTPPVVDQSQDRKAAVPAASISAPAPDNNVVTPVVQANENVPRPKPAAHAAPKVSPSSARVSPVIAPPAPPTGPKKDSRCNSILDRAQLGETLTEDEKFYLVQNCQ
jgi:serine/threonine protein kinase